MRVRSVCKVVMGRINVRAASIASIKHAKQEIRETMVEIWKVVYGDDVSMTDAFMQSNNADIVKNGRNNDRFRLVRQNVKKKLNPVAVAVGGLLQLSMLEAAGANEVPVLLPWTIKLSMAT